MIRRNLDISGLNETWLDKQLAAAGICSAEKVYLMTVDGAKKVFIAPMEAKAE